MLDPSYPYYLAIEDMTEPRLLVIRERRPGR
jgi:hypothetical protein